MSRRKTKPPKSTTDILLASQHLLRTFEKTQMVIIGEAEKSNPRGDYSILRFQLSMIRETLSDIDAAIAKESEAGK